MNLKFSFTNGGSENRKTTQESSSALPRKDENVFVLPHNWDRPESPSLPKGT